MALYSGDGVSLLIEVADPVRQLPLTAASGVTVEVDFFAPGKDPKNNPDDRTSPEVSGTAASYDAAAVTKTGLGAWVCYQPTDGWMAGKWSYRVRVSGAYQNVEFGNFTLKS